MLERAILLPGLHGTTDLFTELLAHRPPGLTLSPMALPDSGPQDYRSLEAAVAPRLPEGDEPYAIVAESFSGPLGIRLAAAAPPGLSALVLVNSFVSSPLPRLLSAAAVLGAPALGLGLDLASPLALPRLLGASAPPELTGRVREVLEAIPRQLLSARLRVVASANEVGAYVRTQLPIFYLRSDDDRVVPQAAVDTLVRIRPGLQVTRMPGPHLLLQRSPLQAMQALQRCLADRG